MVAAPAGVDHDLGTASGSHQPVPDRVTVEPDIRHGRPGRQHGTQRQPHAQPGGHLDAQYPSGRRRGHVHRAAAQPDVRTGDPLLARRYLRDDRQPALPEIRVDTELLCTTGQSTP